MPLSDMIQADDDMRPFTGGNNYGIVSPAPRQVWHHHVCNTNKVFQTNALTCIIFHHTELKVPNYDAYQSPSYTNSPRNNAVAIMLPKVC